MRGRHSGSTPHQRPPKPSKSEPPPDHVEGDLMNGRDYFEPFTPPKPDNDATKDES